MRRGRIPLTALRSFEVAGRLQSFTRAAEELCISQAAVSRQVNELEQRLQRPLFVRMHRGVRLTDDGRQLLGVLTRCFDEMGDALDGLDGMKAGSTITISCEPSFAACWLAPNLAEFQRVHPAIDVELDSDPRLTDFRGGRPALAIRYSATATHWPRSESRHLADVEILPVAAPSLLEQAAPLRQPRDLADFTLLHEENRDLWRAWLSRTGVSVAANRGPIFADGGLVLQAVLRGQGVALMDALFAAEEIEAGRLVHLFDAAPMPHGAYWLVARRFGALPVPASSFVDWIGTRLGAA
ncbi:LysR substrate-binding domain-containing protein [Pseudoxanthomonas putridarboris]|uniref:LysR substrate-binding domain-containing protein n=1 Tax=Pseudoxanthomonas putridarboris TaxID=752605 RepID=A0ABU9IVZ9_9GAMM